MRVQVAPKGGPHPSLTRKRREPSVPARGRAGNEPARQPDRPGKNPPDTGRVNEETGINHDVEGAAERFDECPPVRFSFKGIPCSRTKRSAEMLKMQRRGKCQPKPLFRD
jgi:hypothetical protein